MKTSPFIVLLGLIVPSFSLASECLELSLDRGHSWGDGPQVLISASQEVFCVGDCIQLMDESISAVPIVEWNWTLIGGSAVGESESETSSQQNPEVCYNTSGSFWVFLSVTDLNGNASEDSLQLIVDPCTGPINPDFGASDTVICTGDCVNFQNQSLGYQTNYTWIFSGINQVSTEENPQTICYDTPGTYDVVLIVENGIGPPQQAVKTDFITVENCINPPVPMFSVSADSICIDDCVNFFDESTGLGSESFEYEWIFEGAPEGSGNSTEANPSEICYSNPGDYDVILTIKRPGIPDSATLVFPNAITVLDAEDCKSTMSTFDHIDTISSIAIHPNPALNYVFVDVEKYSNMAHSIAAFSIYGRLMHMEQLNSSRIELDLTNYARGVYILNLLDNSGNSIAQSRLIKK